MSVKPSLSIDQQVELLINRGLHIDDEQAVAKFLQETNYYRFSGYARYFQVAPHLGNDMFQSGVSFETIRSLYELDTELRDTLALRLGRVELLLRTHVARVIADIHGPYGLFLDEGFYADVRAASAVEACQRDIERSRERHILKHVGEPGGPLRRHELPIWSAVEAFSFETLSKCIELGGNGGLANEVASSIGSATSGFAYRVRALVYLRNRCAHHSRLWHHSVVDAGPTPNNVRIKAKRAVGQFEHRSIVDVVASLDDILSRGADLPPVLPELLDSLGEDDGFWNGLRAPRSPRDHTSDQ